MVRSKVHFCIEYVLPAEAAALAAAARVVTEPRAGAAHRTAAAPLTLLESSGRMETLLWRTE